MSQELNFLTLRHGQVLEQHYCGRLWRVSEAYLLRCLWMSCVSSFISVNVYGILYSLVIVDEQIFVSIW